jgi:NAD(P)-dependent dehydrogenase (short-subunit alcohol dehydrogenase family)
MGKARVVVVTGGSAGVGRAVARTFARHGDRVAVLARGEERVRAACLELREMGADALGIVVDVADAAQVENAAQRIEHELGPISVWVNNAATTVFAPVVETTPDEFRQVTQVTYLGTVHGTLAALRRMRRRNQGTIVQVGSALAYRSIPLQSAYCGSKAAIRGFTDSLRSELIRERSAIRLTMVQLCAFNTPQFDWARNKLGTRTQPVPPIFQPELAGEAIFHAAAHPRREVWVGWPAVKAILSTRVLPGLGDRLAAGQAWDGQQTREPAPVDEPGSLFAPVPGRFGAHGRFDAEARRRSIQWSLSRHRTGAAAAAAAVALGGLAWLMLPRRPAGRPAPTSSTRSSAESDAQIPVIRAATSSESQYPSHQWQKPAGRIA